jgi:hypothetical protein
MPGESPLWGGLLIGVTVSLLLALCGCGGVVINAAASAQLSLSANMLEFGNVTLNSSATKTLTITSSGNAPLTVSSVTVNGAEFAMSGTSFPATLEVGQAMTLQVSFAPVTASAAKGTITIAANSATQSTTTVTLTGNGIMSPSPQLSVSSDSLDFGSVTVNSTSTKRLTLTSSGNSALSVNSVAVTGAEFTVSGSSFPVILNPGESATLQVSFVPTVAGAANEKIEISSNSGSGSTTTVAVSGMGVQVASPELTLSAASIDFGGVAVNTESTKTVILSSSGGAALTIDSVKVAGAGFIISNATFPATLNPGQAVTLQVDFDPTVTGSATGAINISSNSSSGGSVMVSLHGTGITSATPQLTLSTNSLMFGAVVVNSTSTKVLTLTSSGTAALTIGSVAVSGSGFVISGATFPATLNPGQLVTLQVGFDPSVVGAASGSITISSNSLPGASMTVALSGTGAAAPNPELTLSASMLSFGSVAVNTTSTKALTLTSSGTGPLTIKSVSVAGSGFQISGATFPLTLDSSQSVTLQIAFDPIVQGGVTGTITISSNSSTSGTTAVSLSGTGTAAATPNLTLSASLLSFGNVNVNSSSGKTLTLTSSGTAAVAVNSVTVSGRGFVISGVILPATLNPGQAMTVQVTFDPTVTGLATGAITIGSDSSSSSTNTVALTGSGTAPQLSLSAASLDFGDVNLNTTSTKALNLTSSGTAALVINSVTAGSSGFGILGGTFPATLNPGQSITLQISFDPTTAGTVNGSITISTNSLSGAISTVALSGTGIANPVLMLSATGLDFGSDPVGTPLTLPVKLTSGGSSSVTVSSASITGAGFTFSGATFPVTLIPNVALTVQVQFDPVTTGAASGALTFTSDSSLGKVSIVTLAGNGTSTTTQHQVTLTWNPPVNSPVAVASYNIYRASGGSSSFQLLNAATSTTFVDLQVTTMTTYTYYVTSVDGAGTESIPSSKVTVTVP